MMRVFETLDNTVNKSTIKRFKAFLNRYPDVDKWILCSDYCLDDKKKPNRVISFVLFPYILDLIQWQDLIQSMQKTDLKHTRTISEEFCTFLNKGYVFSFNFILEKNCIFDKWKDKESLIGALKSYIEMTEKWQITTPNNKDYYSEAHSKLKRVLAGTKQKSFNYKLLSRIVYVSFLASYIKYLLLREHTEVTLYSWLSDIDKINTWQNGICMDIYHICSHCLCVEKLGEDRCKKVKEIYPSIEDNKIFYEQLNRVADIICGGIADFDYKQGTVSGKKQCTIMEDIVSDNEFISLIDIMEKNIAIIEHKKSIPPTN